MFSIDTASGVIHFPDGFQLPPPYESERYFEYAAWVSAGNSPAEIQVPSLLAAEDVEVRPDQARIALSVMGVYENVLALMANPVAPVEIKIKWEFTLSFRRNDPTVIAMAETLQWSKQFLDELFALAQTIQ